MKKLFTTTRRVRRITIRILLMLFISCVALSGQNTGSVTGSVTDYKTGAGLPGVNVSLVGTTRGAVTDLQGSFSVSELPPGTYRLRITMMGYVPFTVQMLQVAAGVPVDLEIELKSNILASPQVVVTSSRKDQDILESPFSVSTIGPREIQAKAIINMADIMVYEPGVNLVNGQLNIRGASGYTLGAGSRSLLLIDGIPILGSAAGNISWGNVPSSEVDRVEIVKSGGSAMYGSSAMGGVVNIITRNAPPKPETRFSAHVGAYSQPRVDQWTWRDSPGMITNAEFSHSRKFGDHAGWVRFQRNYDESFGALNWIDSYTLSGKVKFNFGNAHSASLFANRFKEDKGLLSTWKSPAEPFEAPTGSEKDHSDGVKLILNGQYAYVHSPQLSLKLRTSSYTNTWESFGADPDYSNEQKYFAEVMSSWNVNERLSTVTGLSVQNNVVEAQIFGEHDSRSLAAYVLGQQKLRDITLSLGARWESYAVDGESLDQLISPQIALNWKPEEWLALRVSTGKGFRVPTVAEMFTRARRSIFYVEPNPDLISETSLSQELGLSLISGSIGVIDLLKFDAAIFQNRFQNLIEPVPDSLAIIHFENISDARITGLELGLGVSLWDNLTDLKTSYTWLNPEELDADGMVIDTLSYRYRHHWVSTLAST